MTNAAFKDATPYGSCKNRRETSNLTEAKLIDEYWAQLSMLHLKTERVSSCRLYLYILSFNLTLLFIGMFLIGTKVPCFISYRFAEI
jgi:hypothetical protein